MGEEIVGEQLVDPFGRTVRDLRISVTDRCNFRCQYCMPAEGMQWLPREEILSFEEIERFARICINYFGFDGIRLTGGEPLVRAHLPELVERLALLGVDTALTTNGATLRMHAKALAEAGLKRINISLDSLQPERFLELTRRDELDRVLDGIEAAVDAGLKPVKINAVMMRGINDDEIVDFAEFGRDKGLTVRFIEFMPLEAGDVWNEDLVVPADEIVEKINKAIPIEPIVRGSEPAERWRYLDGKGEVGVIASVTKPFCGDCDRVRLTAEGQFRTCLFAVDEFDMRSLLRSEANDEEIAKAIVDAVGTKWAGHSIGQVNFIRPSRTMSQIGG
ncbi:MAG: GTP 3',8-cyclase MoaA [Acidimicrobiaceae bacterium]|nr:GTP 3',8-cyclase MoaA [Acidimicrobiaceae bacterium]MEC7426467.1 GTP 3',8-cyclase MoaA [Actinomycetota bacterium]MEC9088481.1 GTP 3',8-cyclase MoaA [Actinomycetota bacterium]HAQ44438.1 GTP 3',8-cyclase MoaA [Acidimicrobiaceae bacterium]|tara:strand:+ start:23970 stop:24968 length:999 start_codon:yes stop_codon:yes gene_type:complete